MDREEESFIHQHCERTELYSRSARTHSFWRHSLSSTILRGPRPTVRPCFSTPPWLAASRTQAPEADENERFEVSSVVVCLPLGNGLTSLARDQTSFRAANGAGCSRFCRPVI